MKKIKWYINRLKAMNPAEILWRFGQKSLQQKERKAFCENPKPVFKAELSKSLIKLNPHVDRIYINKDNPDYSLYLGQTLFEKYSYDKFETKWNHGFQTDKLWPYGECSYDIDISQREDIGDIRTNWELNRHYQFCGLAKNYYVTGDISFLKKLSELFYDWNDKNRFLCGVEWTSAMEIAIRVNSWIYTYCFLSQAFCKYKTQNLKLLQDISNGILCMTEYILKHRARYSSANNHLIVEMYAVAVAGIFYNYEPYFKPAFDILTRELSRQNSSDGVNLEMSLHYQSFVMEAYGLLMLNLKHNNIKIPEIYEKTLDKMSEFLCDCCGDFGETVVFGDNDEGKILDFTGKSYSHYRYVLELMSLVLNKRYIKTEHLNENLCWLCGQSEQTAAAEKPCYVSPIVRCYKSGGYTLLRNKAENILIGIDHADLGYGALAAHGHADALSFQMFINGEPVFCDSGTYNYHISKQLRNSFRSTLNHNTVCVNNREQSQMLGAFLWGRKAKCSLISLKDTENSVELSAEHNGYSPIAVKRQFVFNKENELLINDIVKGEADCVGTLLLSPKCSCEIIGKTAARVTAPTAVVLVKFSPAVSLSLDSADYSLGYCSLEKTKALRYTFKSSDCTEIKTEITVSEVLR